MFENEEFFGRPKKPFGNKTEKDYPKRFSPGRSTRGSLSNAHEVCGAGRGRLGAGTWIQMLIDSWGLPCTVKHW